jgi:aarF domain-containing kinase
MKDEDRSTQSKQRAFSLLKTIGSTAMKAGKEALQKKLNMTEEDPFSVSSAALRLTKGLDELKGAAMKIGQIISMMDDELLPKGWKEALSKLQSEATARDWSEIEPILLNEWENLNAFSLIDKQSVHAASIAQVHSAFLKNGEKVALKVQYPNLEQNIKSDLISMQKLIKVANVMPNLANYDHLFVAAEEMFKQELDFEREKNFYESYYEKFASNPEIVVPKTIPSLCTKKILVTQWIEGINLQKWIDQFDTLEIENKEEIRNKIGALLLEVIFTEILLFEHIQSDPNPGNFLITKDNKLALLDFGATQRLQSQSVTNYMHLCLAGIENNRADLFRYAKKLGFLLTGDSDEVRQSFLTILQIALEPFHSEHYSWKNSTLSKRLNSESLTFMKLTRFRAPSGEILFMNRRLAGNLMMMEKLGPAFNARSIFLKLLKERETQC